MYLCCGFSIDGQISYEEEEKDDSKAEEFVWTANLVTNEENSKELPRVSSRFKNTSCLW